jgi:Spy/CpxP family protein refolding chaperone
MQRVITGLTALLVTTVLLVPGQNSSAQMVPEDPEPLMEPFGEPGDMGPGMGWFEEEDMAFQRGPSMRGGGPMGMGPPELADTLNLSEAQKDRMEALRTAFAKDVVRLRADVEVATIELHEAMAQTSPKAADVQARAAKVSQARAKLFERTVAFRVEMKNVLTPEQQKIMKEGGRRMMRERRAWRLPASRMHGPMKRGPRGDRGFDPRFMPRWMPGAEVSPRPEP